MHECNTLQQPCIQRHVGRAADVVCVHLLDGVYRRHLQCLRRRLHQLWDVHAMHERNTLQ